MAALVGFLGYTSPVHCSATLFLIWHYMKSIIFFNFFRLQKKCKLNQLTIATIPRWRRISSYYLFAFGTIYSIRFIQISLQTTLKWVTTTQNSLVESHKSDSHHFVVIILVEFFPLHKNTIKSGEVSQKDFMVCT